MPRFGFASPTEPSFTSSQQQESFSSPAPYTYGSSSSALALASPINNNLALSVPGFSSSDNNGSVNLSCSSHDGKAIYSLGFSPNASGYYVERRTLPLHQDGDNAPINSQQQQQQQQQQKVILPEHVQVLLDLTAPVVELIYVEADAPQRRPQFSQPQPQSTSCATSKTASSLLCVYTRRAAFYLELVIDPQGQMVVAETLKAFERVLENSDDALTILRIRPAPQRRNGAATLSPRGAMAMLTFNKYSNEYCIVLQHDYDEGLLSIPVSFSLEELSGDPYEQVTDFCFAQSGEGLSLFSTMTVLLLKGSGDILAASPVLFDGSVVHKACLTECLDYLDYQISTLHATMPKSKQCKAARTFLMDAFLGSSTTDGNFIAARIIAQAKPNSAVTWPVQAQGPVLRLDSAANGNGSAAVVIANFAAPDAVGVAVGSDGYGVTLGMVSPSCLLPRFSFESPEDTDILNEALHYSGAVVQRLILKDDSDEASAIPKQLTNLSLALVHDPFVDSMLHYVTAKGITTVTTNAMRHALQNAELRNSAWISVSVTTASVEGAIVGSDSKFGHVLIARLSDGSLVPVNVTESRCLHEMKHLINPEGDTKVANRMTVPPNPSDAALKKLDELPPLYEVVDPLLKKVTAGLSGMGKIVGTSTATKDIAPDQLAVALAIKERCDKEVVLPLTELRRTVQARREVLKVILKDQKQQAKSMKQSVLTMQAKTKAINEKAETAKMNAAELSTRTASVLQASESLMPTLTQAEYDYIQQLKRLQANVSQIEASFESIRNSTASLNESMRDGRLKCKIQLDKKMLDLTETVLDGEDQILTTAAVHLKADEARTEAMMKMTGLSV